MWFEKFNDILNVNFEYCFRFCAIKTHSLEYIAVDLDWWKL